MAPSYAELTDQELLAAVRRLATAERAATAELIRSLIELDVRRLYLGEGYSSLFTFCTQALRLSEHAAYDRIEVARIAARIPSVLDELSAGGLTLTTARLLAPHMSTENSQTLLDRARRKSKREVVAILANLDRDAALHRRGDCAGWITTVGPDRIRIEVTVSAGTRDKLLRAQSLLRHAVPDGDLAEVFDRALTALVLQLERRKFGLTARSRPARAASAKARRLPAAVRRQVWHRDGAQCAYRGRDGRCAERNFLEFHHVVPFAEGGEATVANIELRCRAHNAYEARLWVEAGENAAPDSE